MSGRTWITIVTSPLSHPSKSLTITRGVPSDVKPSNTKATSLFSLQIVIDYTNGYQATIPILADVVAALKDFVDGNLSLPPYGHFIESDGRHFIILENKNKEITLSFEKNMYRNTIRLSSEEVGKILRFARVKQMLYDKTKSKASVYDLFRPANNSAGTEMSLWIQVWTALSLKTPHETGTCDCYDVIEGMPCNLSNTRSTADRIKELMSGVSLYAETLRNIQMFRDMLGMTIPFDGFNHKMMEAAGEPDNENDFCFLVRNVLKQ